MAATMKRIKLEEMKTLMGFPFREADRDEAGNPIMEAREDSKGRVITQVPRDTKTGNALPNAMPEPVYIARTHAVSNPLPMLLKRLYLNIPREKLTRENAIYGSRLFDDLAVSPDGYIEIHDDIYTRVKEWLKDEDIGLEVFGTDLYTIEKAMDNLVNREGEPTKKPRGKEEEKAE